MKFIADENFPRSAVLALRGEGFDVLWIAETAPGSPDDEVLGSCVSTNRTLLTFDKDFGELAFMRRLPAQCGIILFRIMPQTPNRVVDLVLSVVAMQESWTGQFSVVTADGIRIRRLPDRA